MIFFLDTIIEVHHNDSNKKFQWHPSLPKNWPLPRFKWGLRLVYTLFRFIIITVCLFLGTADRIKLKFYTDLHNHQAQRTKQDGVCGMHNYAEISIIMRNREKWALLVENGQKHIFSFLHLLVATYSRVSDSTGI